MCDVKLLPCPFCGGEAKMKITKYGGSYVMCKSCFCRTMDGGYGVVKAMWNRREGKQNEQFKSQNS